MRLPLVLDQVLVGRFHAVVKLEGTCDVNASVSATVKNEKGLVEIHHRLKQLLPCSLGQQLLHERRCCSKLRVPRVFQWVRINAFLCFRIEILVRREDVAFRSWGRWKLWKDLLD